MGKGSKRRNEDTQKVWDNWDRIFGKKDKLEESDKKDVKEEKPNDDDFTKTK